MLVEDASDTTYRVQVCKHEIAFQQGNHDSRSSPRVVGDVELPVYRHSCLVQHLDTPAQRGNDHRVCRVVIVVG